jgi:hypothetical protein
MFTYIYSKHLHIRAAAMGGILLMHSSQRDYEIITAFCQHREWHFSPALQASLQQRERDQHQQAVLSVFTKLAAVLLGI